MEINKIISNNEINKIIQTFSYQLINILIDEYKYEYEYFKNDESDNKLLIDKISQNILNSFDKLNLIKLDKKLSKIYYENDELKNKINELKNILKTEICLDLNNYKKIIEIDKLNSVDTLDIENCKNIRFIGGLQNIKVLIIDEEKIGEIHLLKNLENVIIMTTSQIKEKCYKKTQKRIKKLKKINVKIKIEIKMKPDPNIASNYNVMRIMFGFSPKAFYK
jgi:hypothetical protein